MKSTFGDRVGQRTIIVFVFLVLLCAFLFFAEIFSGSVKVSVRDLFEILFLKNENSVKKNIFFLIRLPRTLMAFLLGGALSVSGFLLQTYFQNPIAGPFVLGISSGSRFCVSLCLLLFFKMGLAISSVSLVLASFVGAILVSFIMLLFSKKISGSASLLVAGLMSSYIFSGLSEGVSAFAVTGLQTCALPILFFVSADSFFADFYFFAFKTIQCVSLGRILCANSWSAN